MSDYYDLEDYYFSIMEKMEQHIDYGGPYTCQEEEDMAVTEKMYGRGSRMYRDAVRAYRRAERYNFGPRVRSRGHRTIVPIKPTFKTPTPKQVTNPVFVIEGRHVITWFLNERCNITESVSLIIIAYMDDWRLEEIFKNLHQLRLT